MERLTIRLENGEADLKTCSLKDPCEYCYDVIRKLAGYEDLEEQGLLLRLPCKVGDKLYQVISSVEEYEVTAIGIYKDKVVVCTDNLKTGIGFSFDANRIGRRYFLTKAEAEKKLAEMEK